MLFTRLSYKYLYFNNYLCLLTCFTQDLGTCENEHCFHCNNHLAQKYIYIFFHIKEEPNNFS